MDGLWVVHLGSLWLRRLHIALSLNLEQLLAISLGFSQRHINLSFEFLSCHSSHGLERASLVRQPGETGFFSLVGVLVQVGVGLSQSKVATLVSDLGLWRNDASFRLKFNRRIIFSSFNDLIHWEGGVESFFDCGGIVLDFFNVYVSHSPINVNRAISKV